MRNLLILLFLISPPAFAAAAFVASNTAGCANSCTATTTSTNCSGANFMAAYALEFVADPSAGTMSDSQSNTWHHLTLLNDGGGSGIETVIWYAWNASSSSTQTFSFAGTSFPGIVVQCFSGVQSSSDPFDVQNGAIVAASTSPQPGSITPGANGEAVFTGVASFNGTDTFSSINSSFTINGAFQFNSNLNIAAAYLIQGTAGAVNPTWTATQNVIHLAAIASFKAAAGGVADTIGYISPYPVYIDRLAIVSYFRRRKDIIKNLIYSKPLRGWLARRERERNTVLLEEILAECDQKQVISELLFEPVMLQA